MFGFLVTHNHLDRRFHKAFGACLQNLVRADALKYYGVASLLDLTDPDPVVHTAECLLALSRDQEAARALRFALGQIKGEAKHAALGERVKALLELSLASATTFGPHHLQASHPARREPVKGALHGKHRWHQLDTASQCQPEVLHVD